MQLIDAADFKELMSHVCSSVAVVATVAESGTKVGFTATSVQPVSTRPPIISFCQANSARSQETFKHAKFVGISFLSDTASEIGLRYATSAERFPPHDHFIGERNVPLMLDAVFHLVVHVSSAIDMGESRVYFCHVISASPADSKRPLLYYRREFRV